MRRFVTFAGAFCVLAVAPTTTGSVKAQVMWTANGQYMLDAFTSAIPR